MKKEKETCISLKLIYQWDTGVVCAENRVHAYVFVENVQTNDGLLSAADWLHFLEERWKWNNGLNKDMGQLYDSLEASVDDFLHAMMVCMVFSRR